MGLTDDLANHLEQFTTSPFLFVGSGLSRRYIGLDDWEGLLRRIAALTSKPYEFFRASGNGKLPNIATAIAEALHPIWWDQDAFAGSRAEFSGEAVHRASAMKIEVARYLRTITISNDLEASLEKELSEMRRAVIDGIITTNFDALLEEVFPDFKVFVGQDQLLFSSPQSIGEIYKIHGCCSRPNSLVLTAEDYDVFDKRNAYLAAKLLTVFVEHPVIFLGYSLSDRNVSSILRSIGSCLTTDNIHQLRDRLIFVQWNPEAEVGTLQKGNIVAGGFNIPVITVDTDSLLPVYTATSKLKRRFPARILRQLKEHVYSLVKTNDPKEKLYVQDIDEEGDLDDLEVVFGVGALKGIGELGYTSLSREDLIGDVMEGSRRYQASMVVHETLPTLLKTNTYVPIFGYLREGGFLDDDDNLKTQALDTRVVKAAQADLQTFAPPQYYQKKKGEVRAKCNSIEEIGVNFGMEEVIFLAPLLPEEDLSAESLLKYIHHNMEMLNEGNGLVRTQFVKLVCIYDWLRHGRR